ncbi:hypothetical protein AAHA92_22473 [Salvia divinorum]|uniref:SWIM-type domain-containing protein n=1 Tax=Salvia divinorum TaxID=28513 RepID=A0ABD1GPB7_SALDI
MSHCDNFGICFHHGGSLVKSDGWELYIGGDTFLKHDFDVDRFGYFDLVEAINILGYKKWSRITFKLPMKITMIDIRDDKDVMEMLSQLGWKTRVLNVYIVGETQGSQVGVGAGLADGEGKGEGGVGVGAGLADGEGKGEGGAGVGAGLADGEGEAGVGVGLADGESVGEGALSENEDKSYIPSCGENEDDTNDEMSLSEFLTDDEEYIEARKKVKDAYVRSISDDLFTGCTSAGDEDVYSDYVMSDEDVVLDTSDEEDESVRIREKIRRGVYDPNCDHKAFKVALGMKFVDGFQARDALTDNAIENGREIHFKRANKSQVEANCKDPCEWKCYGSEGTKNGSLVIKYLNDVHTCPRNMKSKIVTSNWIARKYLNVFRLSPDMTIKELGRDLVQRFAHDASRWKLYHAKKKVIHMLAGTVEDHYAKLRRYILELIRVDKKERFELDVDIGSVFKSIYIGFSGLKKGFIKGCRRVIGLDGAFLKTYLGGVILSPVATDGNNEIFPIAWAVVQVENEVNWKWFVSILAEELNLGEGVGITIISDQQKGLENAVKNLIPLAEHRNCVRHIYSNWRKTHKDPSLKGLFWKVVTSMYIEEYNLARRELERYNAHAYVDLMDRNPTRFYIRTSLMERQYKKLQEVNNRTDVLCPKIRKKVEKLTYKSRHCVTVPALGGHFEVSLHERRFVVTPASRSCACRVWDITGIPCVHGCAVINFLNKSVESYVSDYFKLEKYKLAYGFGIPPLNGENLWPPAQGCRVIPPPVKKMPGRPKKMRKRDCFEKDHSRPHKLKKKCVMTCQRCLQQGHNSRSCKNAPVPKPHKEKGKQGRPRKVLQLSQGDRGATSVQGMQSTLPSQLSQV